VMPAGLKKIINYIVEVRPAESGDADLIAAWLGRAAVRRYLSSSIRDRVISPQLIAVALKRQDQSWIVVVVDGNPVGLLVLDDFDACDGIANLWYCLGELSMRGRHIMPNAINLLTSLPPLPVQVMSAWVGSNNQASLRCLKRAGFRRVGIIKNAFRVDGVHDRVIFEKQINLNDK